MSKLFSRGWGILMLLIGLLGVAFSSYSIIKIRSTAERMRSDFPVAVGHVERLVSSVHRRGETAVGVVQATRERFDSFRIVVEDLARETQDRRLTSVLNTLDVEILANIESVEEFVRSMHVSLSNAGSALLLLESIPFVGGRLSSPPAAGAGDLKNLAQGLADASAALEQLSTILQEIRMRQSVDDRQVARLQGAMDQVELQLTAIQQELTTFSDEIEHLAGQLTYVRRHSDRWIDRFTGFGIVFFVCFGFSQLHLIFAGCRLISRGE